MVMPFHDITISSEASQHCDHIHTLSLDVLLVTNREMDEISTRVVMTNQIIVGVSNELLPLFIWFSRLLHKMFLLLCIYLLSILVKLNIKVV